MDQSVKLDQMVERLARMDRWMSWVDDKIREFDALTRSLNNLVARVDTSLDGVDGQLTDVLERLVELERGYGDANEMLERLELLELAALDADPVA